jgi:Tfp pilus assembly protein PilF/2-polyprenyl-3-methyl-5-hydroxy-6-metoxy-1,4-benzoquinol methylase
MSPEMSSLDEGIFSDAMVSFQAGRLNDAERHFKELLRHQPKHVAALNLLSVLLTHLKRYTEAERYVKSALEVSPSSDATIYNYGIILKALNRPMEALARFDEALAINASVAETWNNSGTVLNNLNRYDEALLRFDRAIGLQPKYSEAFYNKGNSLAGLGRGDDARAAYRHALALQPGFFEALNALALESLDKGDIVEALNLALRAFASNETPETKSLVVACLRSPLVHPGMGDLRNLLLRALSEVWIRPSQLAPACSRFLALNTAVRDNLALADMTWPKLIPPEKLLGSPALTAIGEDGLFRALLETTPVCEVALERLASGLRFSLLTAALSADCLNPSPQLDLYCAIARQCFINSYVFIQSDTEVEHVRALQDALLSALASGAAIPVLTLLAVAAYVPLYTLPGAETLLDRTWADSVAAVLAQQVRAPLEEKRLRVAMPILTTIDDDVSTQVRDQYEENPYPQWVKSPPVAEAKTVDTFIRDLFPLSAFVGLDKSGDVDVLVAGCGTGQQSIDVAQRYKAARVLAIDLSLTSLCYAQRQTRALGLNNIEYAQADIMNLPSTGRTFDVVEALGVLHHLGDPFAGWRALLSLLRPNGIMTLGFYSETARRDIVAAREFVTARGYRPTADDIRRSRQELFDCADGTPLKNVTLTISDFYSLSECRDLLFHSQEHRLNLPEIAEFIAANNLQFLGFNLDWQTARNYALQFPGDAAMTDLAQWHRYEASNPHTFIQMYQFWVQRK